MIAYIDASVMVRFITSEPDRLEQVMTFDERVTSLIAEVECLRTVQKAQLAACEYVRGKHGRVADLAPWRLYSEGKGSMKATIENTDCIVDLNLDERSKPVQARIWKGVTEKGIPSIHLREKKKEEWRSGIHPSSGIREARIVSYTFSITPRTDLGFKLRMLSLLAETI